MLTPLHSPEQVLAMFPEGHRPSLRRLISTAKLAGCCCKLGKGIGFTDDHVKGLIDYISQGNHLSPHRPKSNPLMKEAPKPGEAYLRARALLTEVQDKKNAKGATHSRPRSQGSSYLDVLARLKEKPPKTQAKTN